MKDPSSNDLIDTIEGVAMSLADFERFMTERLPLKVKRVEPSPHLVWPRPEPRDNYWRVDVDVGGVVWMGAGEVTALQVGDCLSVAVYCFEWDTPREAIVETDAEGNIWESNDTTHTAGMYARKLAKTLRDELRAAGALPVERGKVTKQTVSVNRAMKAKIEQTGNRSGFIYYDLESALDIVNAAVFQCYKRLGYFVANLETLEDGPTSPGELGYSLQALREQETPGSVRYHLIDEREPPGYGALGGLRLQKLRDNLTRCYVLAPYCNEQYGESLPRSMDVVKLLHDYLNQPTPAQDGGGDRQERRGEVVTTGPLTNREAYDVVMSELNPQGSFGVERERYEGSHSTFSICDQQVTGISVKREEYGGVVTHTIYRDGIKVVQYSIKPNDLPGETIARIPPTKEDRALFQYIQSRVEYLTLTGVEGAKWRERIEGFIAQRTATPTQDTRDSVDISKLFEMLDTRLNYSELRTLCMLADIDYDDLQGEGKQAKVRELISYCKRRECIPELVKVGKQQRPDIPWSDVTTQPTAFTQPTPPFTTSPSSSAPNTQLDSILIVTVTKVEAQAVLDVFSQAAGTRWTRQATEKKTYYNLGTHGGVPVFMVRSEPGTATPGGALLTVHQAIRDLHPQAVIMCGIAFGLRPSEQQLGDILVAKQIQCYEPQKVDMQQGRIPRGDLVTSAERLLDRFRGGELEWQGAPTHFGLVLSGEKLINDPTFRDRLLEAEPEAVGGDMEAAGLYAAARDAKVDWILVKAICDWADGKKNDDAHPLAASNAAQFVLHVLRLGGWNEVEQRNQPVFHA